MTGSFSHPRPERLIADATSFGQALDVSRETLDRLRCHADLLCQWQGRMNLVGPATLPTIWHRHFFDSAQLISRLPRNTRRLVDLGSGAGFPGLVLAIMGVPDVHLIESNRKKAIFLREVARRTRTAVTIHGARCEDVAGTMPGPGADIVTARAVAPVKELLDYAAPLLHESGMCLFLKSRHCAAELQAARKTWAFQATRIPGDSDPRGIILRIEALRHA